MKKISCLLLCVFSIAVSAQQYTVIHSIGKIIDTKSGKYLTKGVKIDESASLMFETKGARAAVLSSSRGRFVIQEKSKSESKSDIVYTLSSVLSPARGRLSTRAAGINNKIDFENHFGDGPVAMLGGKYELTVSPNSYPINENQFFYAQYQYKGEAINKKLSNDGSSLLIMEDEFYSIDNSAIDPQEVSEIYLYYYNANTQESTQLTEMRINPVCSDDLKSIADQLEYDKEGIMELINDLYGKCSEKSLDEALGL